MVSAGGLIPYNASLFMEHLSKPLIFAMNQALKNADLVCLDGSG